MKKLYFILIALVTVSMANAQYSGGDGDTNPYQIANATDLVTLSTTSGDWDKNFIVTADIDMSGETFHPIGNKISDVEIRFTGTFDGGNKVISNLTITPDANQDVLLHYGLIGSAGGATIKNIGLANVVIDDSGLGNLQRVGGIVGVLWDSGEISNCFSVNGSINGTGKVGGVVGLLQGAGAMLVTDCYAGGIVDGGWAPVGGIVGHVINNAAVVSNCVYYGGVTGNTDLRAIIGKINNYVDLVTKPSSIYFTNAGLNGTSNGTSDAVGALVTSSELEGSYAGLDFTNTWTISVPKGYAVLKSFNDADVPMPVEELSVTKNDIYVIGKTLYVNDVNATNYKVYNLSGMLVTEGALVSSTINLALPQGIYIIKVGADAKKVMLK